MGHACGAKLLEDVGEKENVQVEVVILSERRHAERGLHLLGVGVVVVGDVVLAEPAVEGRLRRESRLFQSCGTVDVIIRVNTLPLQKATVDGVSVQVDEGIARQVDSFSNDADINWRLSMKRSLPSENNTYFVMFLAITLM